MPYKQQLSLNDILERIGQADDYELNQISKAVIRRYDMLFPDWEALFLSLPKK